MTEEDGELTLGRYTLHGEIASGGMATVYLGRLQGPVGFSRVVAIKRMHPHVARDPDFAAMFLDEASLAAHIQHPNVVATLDVVANDDEAFIVMEYIKGASLAALLRDEDRKRIKVGINIAVSLMIGVLSGLHAAHEAETEAGKRLELVHRDVSPQNVLVGLDGLARITDFGVAKAAIRSGVTRDNQIKGKLCYMAPEQLAGRAVDRRADVFAAAAILWEMLAGRRLFTGEDTGAIVARIIQAEVPPIAKYRKDVPPELEAVLRRALAGNLDERFASAQDFADALEEAAPKLASQRTVGAWVRARAADDLARKDKLVTKIEEELSTAGEEEAPRGKPAAPRPAAGRPAPAPAPPAAPAPAAEPAAIPPAPVAPTPTPGSAPGPASPQPGEAPDVPAQPTADPAPAAEVTGESGVSAPVSGPVEAEPAAPAAVPASVSDPGMVPPVSDPGLAPPVSDPGQAPPVSDPGAAAPVSDPGMGTPLSSPAMGTPLSSPAMGGPNMPTPLSSPAMGTPLSTPAMPTPLSTPNMATPLSSPNMPTPLSTAGAAVSAFPKPTADVYAAHERKRKLAIVGAVAILGLVALSLAILGGPSSSDSEPADETTEVAAPPTGPDEPDEPDELDEPDEPDEPTETTSAAASSVVAAPEPSASASATATAQPKAGTPAVRPRPPKGNYLPDMP